MSHGNVAHVFSFDRKEVMNMNKKFLKYYMETEPDLSCFYKFDAKGNVKGVRDMEIVDYLVENVQFFVMRVTPYYYDHGVYKEDYEGVRLKYRIQKLIYRDQIQLIRMTSKKAESGIRFTDRSGCFK